MDGLGMDPGEASDLGNPIGVVEAVEIAAGHRAVTIGREARDRVAAGHRRLLRIVAERRHVYGITTGFGPLANRLIDAEDAATLQRNLIYHLASGVGPDLSWLEARLVVLARLRSLLHGVSGASPDLIERLVVLLASPLAPRLPARGTVGASGDLTPLAHLGLALIGEGTFILRDGRSASDAEVREHLGTDPLLLSDRDGLALVNGTAAMTGVAALNAMRGARLLDWAERLTVGFAEILGGRLEAWHETLSALRPHPGQSETARRLGRHAAGSRRLESGLAVERRLARGSGLRPDIRPLQDAYTVRCAPQVLGALRDALTFHDGVVARELNAVTDNPVFPREGPAALHGGNFMGQHVGIASDTLSVAALTLAGLAERQIARVTDERLNGGLPAFLTGGHAGLDSGLMGAQVTASALLAEMRSRAVPASIQSISTNGANQDIVSMGTIAARAAGAHLNDAAHILAILALAVAQGRDLLGEGFSPSTKAMVDTIRRVSPPLDSDRPLSSELARLAATILDGDGDGDGDGRSLS